MKKNKPLGYYPGCSGLGTSVEYDRSTRAVAAALNIKLEDVRDWSCCGSTPAHTIDHALSTALSARNFVQAEKQGINDLVTPCPSCLKNLRTSLHRLKDGQIGPKAEKLLGATLQEEHTIKSVLQVIHEDVDRDFIKSHVSRPLKGLKVAPYYGCLMSRPAEVMNFGDPENPTLMEEMMSACGAEMLDFPLKTACCGASFGIPERPMTAKNSGRILELATRLGADAIVVACPLCQMNLDLRQDQASAALDTKFRMPVLYFTQMMGIAFDLPEEELGLNKLCVSANGLIRKLGELRREEAAKPTEQKAKAAEGGR